MLDDTTRLIDVSPLYLCNTYYTCDCELGCILLSSVAAVVAAEVHVAAAIEADER